MRAEHRAKRRSIVNRSIKYDTSCELDRLQAYQMFDLSLELDVFDEHLVKEVYEVKQRCLGWLDTPAKKTARFRRRGLPPGTPRVLMAATLCAISLAGC